MSEGLYISAVRFPTEGSAAAIAAKDFYKIHKLVYSAFPDREAATDARVLFRFDLEGDAGYLFVQSTKEPDWSRLPEAIRRHVTGPVPLALPEGERLRFRLLAKPSYRIGRKDSPYKGLRTTLTDPAQQIAWLERKGIDGGFVVEDVALVEKTWHDTKNPERLPNGELKPLYGVQFDGILAVTDPEKLRVAVAQGIGTQKAFGFGLLSLAAVR